METAQTREAQEPWQEEATDQQGDARLAISADGAFVPLVKGEWAEVRTLAIGQVEECQCSDGSSEVHVTHLSYFSRLTDATKASDSSRPGLCCH